MDYITVQIPRDGSKEVLGMLLDIPGVVIGAPAETPPKVKPWLTLQDFAELAGVNYLTARNWVVAEKRVPHTRPSGKLQGKIIIKRSDAEAFLDGKNKRGR